VKRIIVLFTVFSFTFSSCTSLRIKKSIEDFNSSNKVKPIQNKFEGNYSLSISFGEPYGDIEASLQIFYKDSLLFSTVSYFNGEENIPVVINSTELFEGAIFINLVDSEAGNIEMEVYFDDENSISGFYAGQFEFKGERIK
tara:strand:+ start:1420 stop:1842 length:423 start_codon:yes stop_codon:yes gene_type:complete